MVAHAADTVTEVEKAAVDLKESQLSTDAQEDWTPEEERKLLYVRPSMCPLPTCKLADDDNSRKIDFRVLPYLSLIFGLSLLDRSNIAAAYIAGMNDSLDLHIGESTTRTSVVDADSHHV